MPSRTDFSAMECSIARTLDVVGERWNLLIIRDALYGIRRFDDFQRSLGIARNILSDRLTKLVDAGILTRSLYEERPPRYEYRLTEKGRDLLSVVLAMMRWGDRWGPGGAPVQLTHAVCGHHAQPVVCCSHCGGELLLGELRAAGGPVTELAVERSG